MIDVCCCCLNYYAYLFLRRPTYLSADLCFTTILSSFFATYPPSLPNGPQPKSATCSEVSGIWKCMCEIWGIPSPYKSGPQNRFSTISQLSDNINGLYLRHETRYRQSGSALQTAMTLLHRLMEMTWTLVHKWLKIEPELSPILWQLCVFLHCRASLTHFRHRT